MPTAIATCPDPTQPPSQHRSSQQQCPNHYLGPPTQHMASRSTALAYVTHPQPPSLWRHPQPRPTQPCTFRMARHAAWHRMGTPCAHAPCDPGAKTKVQVEYHPMREPPHDKYTTEPTNYLQLLGALKHADTTDRLKHLIQTYGGAFDTVHLAAALARLPKLAKYNNEDLVRGVVTSVPATGTLPLPPRIPRPGARPRLAFRSNANRLAMQLMAMLVGQANVKFVEPPLPEVKGEASAVKGLSLWKMKAPGGRKAAAGAEGEEGEPLGARFSPREVATSVWALGMLTSQGVELDNALTRAAVGEALGALSKANYKQLHAQGTPTDVALLVKGLALIKAWPRQKPVLSELSQWTITHADRFSAKDVQMALRSFVSLGHRDPSLLDALAHRAVDIATDFTPRDIAVVLQALAPREGDGSAGAASSHAALQALAAGVAPQIILMSADDLGSLASALGQLGRTYVSPSDPAADPAGTSNTTTQSGTTQSAAAAAEGSVANPGDLPPWLHSLACFLADKAMRDLPTLRPLQLGAVLDMLVALRVPHGPLLQAVVDGVLSEKQVDPSLTPAAAASLVQAVAVLVPLLSPAATSLLNTPRQPPPTSTTPHAAKPALAANLLKRETALGLGNLPTAPPIDGPAGADEPRPLGLAVPDLAAQLPLPAGPDAYDDAASRTRHYYQGLLTSGAPFTERAQAAMWRVLAVYAAPGALGRAGLRDLASLAGAVGAARLDGTGPLLEDVLLQAERVVEVLTQQDKHGGADLSHAAALTHLAQLMASTSQQGHQSAQLSGAASAYLQQVLQRSASQRGSASTPELLLPLVLRVLVQCRSHGAENAPAARAVARAYAAAVAGGGSPGAGGVWPGHTASGLAPAPRRVSGGKRATAAAAGSLDGPQLASLLDACAASGELDDALAAAAATHVTLLLSSPAQGGADNQWSAGCAAPLLRHAQELVRQKRPVPGDLMEAVDALVGHAREQAGSSDRALLQGLETALQQLKASAR